ncbi:hypothetical protein [Jiangella sp. DSM 45060]|uniref:hypothetical protein n=1 Tax=Jiangella sp. DSM 45060 TaxID=1798224 RepID=UPI00087A95D9|nr:hypothetical protein [Jiangella sp. DSM 45060]SDT30605.1 hypothetical protein SAMN04515669_3480 [Jiangella sp. DSM 45060]
MTQQPWPGDPAAAWRRAPIDGPAPPSRRPAPPDLSDFETFTRLLPHRGEYLAMPLMYGIGGAFCVAVGLHLMRYQRPLDPFDGTLPGWLGLIAYWPPWFLVLGLGVAWLCWAPMSYVRGKRDHPRRLRELYERINRDGIMVQTFLSTLRLEAHEGTDPSRIAIETRIGDTQAGRLHAAFHHWLDALRDDGDARTAAQERIGERRVLPATELFGPEAQGGYLIRATSINPWQVLLPETGDDGTVRWTIEGVRDR